MEKAKGKKLFYRPAGKRKGMYTPTQIICVSFVIVIALGTFLLSLPVASKHGRLDVLDAMFTATDTAWAPWFLARSEDKKRVRLNIISHLLSHIPYEELPAEPVKLPKRKIGKVKASEHPFRVIPELF